MRQLHNAVLALCMSCVFAAGCASLTGNQERSPAADKITVYDGMSQDPRRYRLLKRVWTEAWRSAIAVPAYGSIAEGAADLQNQAVALGGDAIMNFDCYDAAANFWREPGRLVCNGNVIKYLQ